MAEATEVRRAGPTTVRDVPADEFIKAFAAYLKKTGKVCRGLARKWGPCSYPGRAARPAGR